MTLRVVVDSDVCMGSANCASVEPTAFLMNDESVAEIGPGVDDLDRRRLIEVARSCPSGAIELFDGADRVDIFS